MINDICKWWRVMGLSFVICHVPICHAQQSGHYRLQDATQLWRLTQNAAGLSIDSSDNRGYARFCAQHQSGDYARVQEGTQHNQLRFQTERYQTVGKHLYAYGRFDFDYGRTKNRAWADVAQPYDAAPYIAGSDVRGKYDFQDFDFTAALGTDGIGRWRFGLRLDYSVGDLSRLRDPRSRSQRLDYQLTPSVTYSLGSHTVGLNGHYRRRKEKIASVTTVQQDATLKYYLLSGMEHAEGITGGYASFSREWVDHRLGAEATYAYRHQRLATLLSLCIERGSEDIYGQYKYEPGHYTDYRYGLRLHARLHDGRCLHQLDLQTCYDQGYADEYSQQLLQEKDPQTGYTSYHYTTLLTYKKRYQVNLLRSSLHYRLNRISDATAGAGSVDAYLGARLSAADTSNKHLLPQSRLHHSGCELTAEAGRQLAGERLWLDVAATRHWSSTADLTLSDPATDYATQVLLPDMSYYQADYWRARLALTCQFRLKMKGGTARWFVSAYGDYLRTDNSLDAKCVGISIGMFN